MSLQVNWATKVISIPQSYLEFVSGNTYKLDVNQFRLDLKGIEDSEEGMVFLDTHRHNTETMIGGMTLSRVVEMINDYTITFEDGQYIVNLTGANNNILDVVNLNQVSIRSSNSAGLVISQEAWTQVEKEQVISDVGSIHEYDTGRWKIDKANSLMYVYLLGDGIPLVVFELLDEYGNKVDFSKPNAMIYERRPI